MLKFNIIKYKVFNDLQKKLISNINNILRDK